jgi:hypothetical protein
MGGLNRREALWRMGSGAAGLFWLSGTTALAGAAGGLDRGGADSSGLAERLCASSASGAFDVAAGAIRSGADHGALLGAIFLCGVRDIRPRPHGILHAVMMVASSFQLAESVPPYEAWLPVLYNLDDLKRAQEGDRRDDGDWSLKPRPAPRGPGAGSARREFLAAMEAWDAERADRAIVELLPYHDRASLYEILWPLAARCYAFIGHKMIHAAQMERVLGRIGWRHAEPALRSLVMASLVNRDTAAFERSRELARALPDRWLEGKEEPEQSRLLLRELAVRGPRGAQDLVVDSFKDGLGPRTVWDALRLLGSEMILRRPGRSASAGRTALLPVHALTVTNALGHAWRSTRLEGTRRLLILQAAAWLAAMRDDLIDLVGLSMAGPGIDALGASSEEDVPDLAQMLERASPGQVRACLDREPARRAGYLAGLRTALFHKGQEHHQHKYAAALEEESRLVDARWASRILAPAVDYLAHPADAETETYRRSVRALQKAGLRPSGS